MYLTIYAYFSAQMTYKIWLEVRSVDGDRYDELRDFCVRANDGDDHGMPAELPEY